MVPNKSPDVLGGASVPTSSDLQAPTIWTIGHSNHALDRFLALLAAHDIEVLVDVRSQPYSRYTPHFTRDSLREGVANVGIQYLFMGKELGGRPADPSLYDSERRVRYYALSHTEEFRKGIARLLDGIGRLRVSLLCAEEDPSGCHRRRLVGRVLTRHGTRLLHIRRDGTVRCEDSVRLREGPPVGQLDMFEEPEDEEELWKSILPVSRNDRLPPSSEH